MSDHEDRQSVRMPVLLAAIGLLVWATFANSQEKKYQFPQGVPVKGDEVTWFEPTNQYQHEGSVHDRRYNISAAKPFERFGNANYEFPWKTGLTDNATNLVTYKFYQLPKGSFIRYWRQPGGPRQTGNVHWTDDASIQWQYPEGTLFGEVLQTDANVTEVRVMTKKDGKWDFKVYRPFGHRGEVEKYIVSERWSKTRLRNSHPVTVFDETAWEDEIEVSPEGVKEILSRPFKDVTNTPWLGASGTETYCMAPKSSKPNSIVPMGYQGAFLHSGSCVKCHDTVGKHVNTFQVQRDWYGRVRAGSDSVFSFSIFDASCASLNGANQPPVLDRKLAREGLLRSAR